MAVNRPGIMEAGFRTHFRKALKVSADVSSSIAYLALSILMFSQTVSLPEVSSSLIDLPTTSRNT